MTELATLFEIEEAAGVAGHVVARRDRLLQLSAAGLSASRGGRLLFSAVGFELGAGEVIQVTGTNGSGKTTLIRMLCGLSPAPTGVLEWHYESGLVAGKCQANDISYLAHKDGINRTLSPFENIRYYSEIRGCFKHEKLLAALRATGLSGFEHIQCSRLSAGQCRRASIALLLTTQASLWVLDEPLTSLDVDGIRMFEAVLSAHLDRGGMAVMTTHQALEMRHHTIRYTELGR